MLVGFLKKWNGSDKIYGMVFKELLQFHFESFGALTA
jgi:hypothetical protein